VKTEAKVIECLSLLYILGNQVSRFLPEVAYIFLGLPFITSVPTEASFVAFDIPGQI